MDRFMHVNLQHADRKIMTSCCRRADGGSTTLESIVPLVEQGVSWDARQRSTPPLHGIIFLFSLICSFDRLLGACLVRETLPN